MEGWLRVFPAEQLHVIQFEKLQEQPDKVLQELKTFLGMDPNLKKKELWNTNDRKSSGGAPMLKEDYEVLLQLARADAVRTSTMLYRYLGKDPKEWMARWEATWEAVLATCDAHGTCTVNSN